MKVSKVVEQVLSTSREARNSDKELLLRVMERFGLFLSESQRQKFLAMPQFETIRRIRQKIQESGKYLADQTIRRERTFKGLSMQQQSPNLNQDRVERVIDTPKAISWLGEDDG